MNIYASSLLVSGSQSQKKKRKSDRTKFLFTAETRAQMSYVFCLKPNHTTHNISLAFCCIYIFLLLCSITWMIKTPSWSFSPPRQTRKRRRLCCCTTFRPCATGRATGPRCCARRPGPSCASTKGREPLSTACSRCCTWPIGTETGEGSQRRVEMR